MWHCSEEEVGGMDVLDEVSQPHPTNKCVPGCKRHRERNTSQFVFFSIPLLGLYLGAHGTLPNVFA